MRNAKAQIAGGVGGVGRAAREFGDGPENAPAMVEHLAASRGKNGRLRASVEKRRAAERSLKILYAAGGSGLSKVQTERGPIDGTGLRQGNERLDVLQVHSFQA
jgi:hypothetical protein